MSSVPDSLNPQGHGDPLESFKKGMPWCDMCFTTTLTGRGERGLEGVRVIGKMQKVPQ